MHEKDRKTNAGVESINVVLMFKVRLLSEPMRGRDLSRYDTRNVPASLNWRPLMAVPKEVYCGASTLPSARIFDPRFLPRDSHPSAVTFHFARCSQLTGGLSPLRSPPMLGRT